MKRQIMILAALLAMLGTLLTPSPARAANAVVGTGSAASCTEAAFDAALTTVNTTGGGTITFNCGASEVTITLTTQKIINLVNVTINGNNRIVLNGSLGVRHFFVGSGVTLTLQNIKLRHGDPLASGGAIEINESTVNLVGVELSNNYADTSGGAIYCFGLNGVVNISNSSLTNNSANTSGGAVYNDGCQVVVTNSTFLHNTTTNNGGGIYNVQPGDVTITSSLFQDNEALDGPGLSNGVGASATLNDVDFYSNSGGYGGGVENSGTITINDSHFRENTVTGSGGGLWNLNGVVTINRSTFNANSAYEGAGINSYGTQLTITYVNLTNNIASGPGGGLYHGGGIAFLTNLTISGNQAVNGGGIYQSSDDNLTLTNATVVNNSASALGGGFYHYNRYAILTNVTLGNNTAPAGSALYEDSPMNATFPGVVQLVNSVIFGSANNCDGGIFTSLGNNISKGTCGSLTHGSDQANFAGELNLSALSANGGVFAMQTMMPTTGSPLIDAGNNSSCTATTDQRGLTRKVDGDGNSSAICDIGAVEFNPLPVFVDVPKSYWANSFIERLYYAGVTGGCITSPLTYCPENNVTRGQMAIFLERGLHGSSFAPPNVSPTFNDTAGHFAEDWIEALKNDGITSGCASGLYCPDNSVTRAQMAVFLLKSTHGASYSPPPATGTFSDVAADYWAAAWIEQLASEGITSGCSSGVYCPESPVTRAQMAIFLVKAFVLP